MTSHTPDTTVHDRRSSLDADPWVTLQRTVAVGMLVAFAFVMLVVARSFIPPLAVAGVLFAVPLVASARRSRGSAIAIGVLSTIWLLLQLGNAAQVVPDLTDPGDVGPFVGTVAMVVVSMTGVVGLVGLLRRAAGSTATRTVQTAAGILALAVLGSGLTAVVVGEEPVTVADGPATVTLRDLEFQPGSLRVPAGTTVTWQWQDGSVRHDVVADGFASDLKADGDFAHTFDSPGTYAYECTVHPGMTGTVTVVAG